MLHPDNIKYLVVHCSDTPDDEDLSISDIHAMHLGFGWHGVGYHRVIRRDGEIQHGRPDCWIGAHVYSYNEVSLGVCLLGCNWFTEQQLDSLELVLRHWRRQHPGAEIRGHCDFENTTKTCPNFDVAAWCIERHI